MYAGASGQMLWQRRLPAAVQTTGHVVNGILYRSASSSPLVTAMRVGDGSVLWQFATCRDDDDTVLDLGDLVCVTCATAALTGSGAPITGETLYALDAHSGQVRWSAPAAHLRAVLAPNLVAAQTPVGLAGLRADSGAVLWTHATTISAGLAGINAPFVLGAAQHLIAYSPDGLSVEALRASNGHLLWNSDAAAAQEDRDWCVLAITASAVIAHSIYGVVALVSASGALRWQHRQAYIGIAVTAAVSNADVVYDGRTSANLAGQLLGASTVADGSPLWPNAVPIGEQATLLHCGTMLYVVDGHEVQALRATDGGTLWQDTLSDRLVPSLSACQ
jgi:outer membrane protein assembly factor BamB